MLGSFFGLGDVAIEAAALMRPALVDPENIEGVLLTGFQYEDERAAAREALARGQA